MPAPIKNDDLRPGFLLGQPFWVVEAENRNAAWDLAQHETEPRDERPQLESGLRPPVALEDDPLQRDAQWLRLARSELLQQALNDPSWLRVGLVCGAGLGKTTTLQWLESAINRTSDSLAFFRELENFPEDLLLDLAKQVNKVAEIGEALAVEHVRQLRDEGKIVLLLDSLDQADPNPKGPTVKALKQLFTEPWSKCRIWVSGRPYAFRVAGPTLRDHRPNDAWRFVRVGQLDEPECKQLLQTTGLPNLPRQTYPKPHRYDDLVEAGRRLARVPRYCRLMALLPRDRFAQLTNEAKTFWELYIYVAADPHATTGMLDDGLRAEAASRLGYHHKDTKPDKSYESRLFQVRLAHDILGAVAFEMFARGREDGRPHPLFRIESDLPGFLTAVRKRLTKAGAYRDYAENPIDPMFFPRDWSALVAMDSHGLKNLLFSADGRDGRLIWGDVSTAAYFAAYWACKWAGADEFASTRGWIVNPLTNENDAFREFWQFAVDLPPEAIDSSRWIELMSALYRKPNDPKQPPVRWSEFIYLTWNRMSGTPAQQEFLQDPNRDKLLNDPEWLAGFIALAHPNSVLPGDGGSFVMGAPADEDPKRDGEGDAQNNPQHEVSLTAYRLHRYCVTNREYELFDPRHEGQRWLSDAKHPSVTKKNPNADDDCPVVNVSWYDAWCFAQWLGEIRVGAQHCTVTLPSEAQWEYACRAGKTTPFTFGPDHDGRSCTPDVCNFNGNYLWPKESELPPMAAAEVYRERTIAVHALGPNVWGFYQMHGNVWESCGDRFSTIFYISKESLLSDPACDDPRGSARVFRGGGWRLLGSYCRASFRSWRTPSDRYYDLGFRLAAVPSGESGKRQ